MLSVGNASKKTMVVNNPTHVRNNPEKIFANVFPHLCPPTLISEDKSEIIAFFNKHKDIVIKPLYAFGGKDVLHVGPNNDNLPAIMEMFIRNYDCPLLAQKFLPKISEGDKRVILIDGKAAGAINRIPPKGQIRSNMVVGGTPTQTTLSYKEQAICEELAPFLKEKELFLVGIDVIDGYLTEINVTSPTGIQAINGFENTKLETIFWDAIEKAFYERLL